MTANVIQMKEPLVELGRRIDDAYERTKIGHIEWIEGSIELAVAHAQARECFKSDNEFGAWRVANGHDHFGRDDCGALVGLGALPNVRRILEDADSTSYRAIWSRCRNAATPTPKSTSPPNPQPEPAAEPKTQETKAPNMETETKKSDGSKSTQKRSNSKLYELGDAVAETLLSKFKHPRMLAHFWGSGQGDQVQKRARLLRYLAVRVEANYPEQFLASGSWNIRLLYPYLPQKLLDTQTKTFKLIHKNHSALAATEELFMKTPECGVTDPPMIAFNKAYAIYQSVIHTKPDIDRSAFVHRQTFADDEGRPPVIVRGTQLWPAETEAGYAYDDLRCAYGLADDVLCIFGERRDVSMATKSLKLRHLLSWFPPSGYNSIGATLDGTMRALKLVVQAYGADKGDVMRSPSPSLKKLEA